MVNARPIRSDPRTRTPARFGLVVMLAAVCSAASCTRPQSTRLTASDLNLTVARMAQSLAASDLLRNRAPASASMVIMIQKVQNLTLDLIPPPEQWMLMARVRASLPIQTMAQQKNVFFQIPPDKVRLLRESGIAVDDAGGPRPTHVMTATFRSSPRLNAAAPDKPTNLREDYYYLEYQILDLATGQVVWSDAFETKRQAKGALLD